VSQYPKQIIESRAHGPAVEAAGDGRTGSYIGTLNTVPSGGQCLVVIPGLDPLHHHEVICPTGATGAVGDLVLVTFDDQKLCWLTVSLGRSSL
jgi:hypothetical protein